MLKASRGFLASGITRLQRAGVLFLPRSAVLADGSKKAPRLGLRRGYSLQAWRGMTGCDYTRHAVGVCLFRYVPRVGGLDGVVPELRALLCV